jgi:glycerate kinase
MTKALLCPNPFKGTLSAAAAARALATGLERAGWRVRTLPLADGGPGTLAALRASLGGSLRRARVRGPLLQPLRAAWLELPEKTAVIESAQAIGLGRRPSNARAALAASSRGLGQLLRAVHAAGARTVWVGLGGSATTDGGVGMARVLGWRFLDGRGRELPEGGGSLWRLGSIQAPARPLLEGLGVRVFCDVANPLYGARGAAAVYGPQKGAGPAQVRRLDRGLRRLAALLPSHDARKPGSGAAGGLGFGMEVFAGARLLPGAAAILDLAGFRKRALWADWVLTGEGRLDRQSLQGKLPVAVARACRAVHRPCAVFCGSSRLSPRELRRAGFSAQRTAFGASPAAAAAALRAAAWQWALGTPPQAGP